MTGMPKFKTTSSGHPDEFTTIFPPDLPWLAKRNKEEIVLPDLPVVDPHHHLWDRTGYRYSIDEFTEDMASGHNIVASVHVEVMTSYRTEGPKELRPIGETEFVKQLADEYMSRYPENRLARGIVGFADLGLGAAVEEILEQHQAAADGRFRGVRYCTGWDSSPLIHNTSVGRRPGILGDPSVRDGAKKLASLGLSLDVWLFQSQLRDVVSLADDLPDLTIVLNHCGGPLGTGPYAETRYAPLDSWRHGIRAIAERPNVVCKLGGLLARGAAFDYVHATMPPTSRELAQSWSPWIKECIEAFGADRCMFESNFPVDKMGTSYSTLWNALKLIAHGASYGEMTSLFSGTANTTYRLGL
jgi:L-fuconolactonase